MADRILLQLESSDIEPDLRSKWEALTRELAAYQSAVVAYSGGVDSSLLAYAAAQALGEQMVAVTVVSSLETPATFQDAADFAAQYAIKHAMIPFDPLQSPDFQANPAERCYLCKTLILQELWQYARQHNYHAVLEGQNADDCNDYRPGSKAVAESGTFSPLVNCGLGKAEIRWLARALGLISWDKPSSPCLATRIPYGTRITDGILSQVAQAEHFLEQKGFRSVRVRYHQEVARVEIDPAQMSALLEMRAELVDYFKQIGFTYVALDLQGYRLGSLNEGLSI